MLLIKKACDFTKHNWPYLHLKLFFLQLQSTSYNTFNVRRGEGVKRFCYVTGEGDNVLTLRSLAKGLVRVEIFPKMALHNI